MSLFVLKSQPSSGEDIKPLSEMPRRNQRGLFSDEEDSEVSISLINTYRNPGDPGHPDFWGLSWIICRTGNSDMHAFTPSHTEISFLLQEWHLWEYFPCLQRVEVGWYTQALIENLERGKTRKSRAKIMEDCICLILSP